MSNAPLATTTTATATGQARRAERVVPPPPLHWVGDGFRVHGYFRGVPQAMRRLDPFLMLDYGAPHHFPSTDTPRGVGVHPHRGFETVTIAWEGAVAHHDSAGGGGVIGPGDVQWMTAGAGILHKEFHEEAFAREGGTFHMAQLWVNLPRAHKLTAPGYQPITAAAMGRVAVPGGGEVRVIAGEHAGVRGPARTFSPIGMFDLRLPAGAAFEQPLPAHHNAAVLIMRGGATVGGAEVGAGAFVVLANEGERLRVEAAAGGELHALVLTGEPLGEPIAAHGPFVMNTAAEIDAAIRDYQRGAFGYLAD